MAAWPHQIHLRSGHTLSHCAASDPHTGLWSPDVSDQSRGAKTETDFVMTHPDNKNIKQQKHNTHFHLLTVLRAIFAIFACCIDGQAYLVKNVQLLRHGKYLIPPPNLDIYLFRRKKASNI